MKMKLSVKAVEEIVSMIRDKPLPVVRKDTGLSYTTLASLARIHLD